MKEFDELGIHVLPFPVSQLDQGSGIEETLKRNQSAWHKSCRDKINNRMLVRAKQKRHSNEEQKGSPAKTPKACEVNKEDVCFFCDRTPGSDILHKASIFGLDYNVRQCASV